MSNGTFDALVVGAGPVGLTAAAALTYRGLKCRLIDKASAPSDKSKALAVWCRSLELLDGLDLAETFVRTGLKLSGGSIFADGKRVVHLKLTSDESPFGFPLMIPQNETERLLTEHLARQGVVVERPIALESFRDTGSEVECMLRDADSGNQEHLAASWLIGCDGAHSTVRHALGLPFTGATEINDWMLADASVRGSLSAEEVSVFWSENGVLAFFPIDRTRFRMIADLGAASASPRPDPTLADAQAILDSRGPGGLTLFDPHWLANFRINERKVADYRRGRVLLAGDAAHIHSPAGGQGMNTGMQDAFNLAWKIALVERGEGRIEPLLASYSLERSAVGDQVLKNAQRVTTLATLRSPVARWVRNHIAPIFGSLQVVQDRIRDEWFELSINYRHSPLSVDARASHSGDLAVGDRLCDVELAPLGESGASSLFRELRGGGYALLMLPGLSSEAAVQLSRIADAVFAAFPQVKTRHSIFQANADATPNAVEPSSGFSWRDATGALYDKLRPTDPELLVVRPDGYIGYRGPAEETPLLDYLDRFLIGSSR